MDVPLTDKHLGHCLRDSVTPGTMVDVSSVTRVECLIILPRIRPRALLQRKGTGTLPYSGSVPYTD